MSVWDETTPTGSEAISQGDDRIREMKEALGDALADEGVFPGPSPSTAPVFRYRGRKGTTAGRPTAGDYGFYANTTLNTLQRDNGSSWEDVSTLIPSGTVMSFFQAAPPVGWTQVTSHNDKMLRVVSGTGGGNGGTNDVSAGLAHTHTVASHVHTIPEASIEHRHETPIVYDSSTGQVYGVAENPFGTESAATAYDLGTFDAQVGPQSNKVFQKTNSVIDYANGSTGGTTLTTDNTAPTFKYVDMILASKD